MISALLCGVLAAASPAKVGLNARVHAPEVGLIARIHAPTWDVAGVTAWNAAGPEFERALAVLRTPRWNGLAAQAHLHVADHLSGGTSATLALDTWALRAGAAWAERRGVSGHARVLWWPSPNLRTAMGGFASPTSWRLDAVQRFAYTWKRRLMVGAAAQAAITPRGWRPGLSARAILRAGATRWGVQLRHNGAWQAYAAIHPHPSISIHAATNATWRPRTWMRWSVTDAWTVVAHYKPNALNFTVQLTL